MVRSPRPGARLRRHRRGTRSTTLAAALATLAVGAVATFSPALSGAAAGAGAEASERSARAAAGDDVSRAAEDAVGFLLDQQAADGGFGEAGLATPDAVSAIAQAAQGSDEWSAKEAVDAVSAAETGGGASPLEALDAAAQADPTPEAAAVMISRAVVAMGLDPENFDPGADGDPVDLVHTVAAGRRADGSYGSLRATAEAALALVLVGTPVNEATRSMLEDAQQQNGGWSAAGTADGNDVDPATTGLVTEALVAAGVAAEGSTAVTRALAFLARNQGSDGGWPAERGGPTDPTATAWAMGAIRAAGHDPDAACWRQSEPPDGEYQAPSATLIADQSADGRIAGDTPDPVSSTAVAVQGLLGRWLPTSRAPAVGCGGGDGAPAVPLSLIVLAVIGVVLIVGAVSIMRSGNR